MRDPEEDSIVQETITIRELVTMVMKDITRNLIPSTMKAIMEDLIIVEEVIIVEEIVIVEEAIIVEEVIIVEEAIIVVS